MYMSRAIAVAILAFVVGIQAQPFNYNDAAIIERSAQPDAYAEAYAYAEAEAYADAELEARALHAGDFVKGAVAAVAANKVANHYGQGTSSLNAALLGGGANVAAHSQHVQAAGQHIADAVHRLVQRDNEAMLYRRALQRRSDLWNAAGY